jgi:preprotein translocase subunit SecE
MGSQINFSGMNKISTYFSESYKELVEKVTWPTWAQLQQSTVIVLVATALVSVVVFAMDAVSKGLLNLVYSLFK